MSSSNNIIPQHRSHSDDEPLPTKAPFDYSTQAMERAKLPKSEQGDSQLRGNDEHCHSKLHEKEPVAHQKIPTAEGHHFFDKENPRPKPVSENEREKVEWFEGQKDPAV